MKMLYSGFDSLYFAVKGALSPVAQDRLDRQKQQAVEADAHQAFKMSNDGQSFHMHNTGKKGGYAYVVDTGHVGSIIAFKKGLSRKDWNGFVEIKSACLVSFGWEGAISRAFDHMKQLGFHRVAISMNRVDYCMDFLNAQLKLDPSHFVAHSRVKKSCHHESVIRHLHMEKRSVAQSDHMKSITLGKMPNRQVIVYDKRAEVIQRRKTYWFDVWGIDRHDPTLTIDRVEIRAGKNELLKHELRTLEDFRRHIGLVLSRATDAVRYIQSHTEDSNKSRAPLHPIWLHAQEHVKEALQGHREPFDPELILTHMKESKAREYRNQIIGNLGGYLGCKGISTKHMEKEIERMLSAILSNANNDSQDSLWRSYNRAFYKWNTVD